MGAATSSTRVYPQAIRRGGQIKIKNQNRIEDQICDRCQKRITNVCSLCEEAIPKYIHSKSCEDYKKQLALLDFSLFCQEYDPTFCDKYCKNSNYCE